MTRSRKTAPRSFDIKDCALISLATGSRALTLRELGDRLSTIDADIVFCHFWGGQLQARFEEREYNNDFASWARHDLHDPVLAERLAVIDPSQLPDPEALRSAVVEVVEERVDEEPYLARRLADREFHFLRAQVVVFDTGVELRRVEELVERAPNLAVGSVFFHFIEARRRHPDGVDDFSAWLADFDGRYAAVIERLQAIDPYFGSLVELRQAIVDALAGATEKAGS